MIRVKVKMYPQSLYDAEQKAIRKAFGKFGYYVRQKARKSIKKPGKRLTKKNKGREPVSDPGSPPYSHLGKLRDFILYDFDEQTRSVVIGPKLLDGRKAGPMKALEEGGQITLALKQGNRRAKFRARPFMGPAFEATKTQLSELLKDIIR